MGYYYNDNNENYSNMERSRYGHYDADAYLRSQGFECHYGHYTDPDNVLRIGAYIGWDGQIHRDM